MSLYSCSQCSFTAADDSTVQMHYDHRHVRGLKAYNILEARARNREKAAKMTRVSPTSPIARNKISGLKLPVRTASATKLLGRLKARICKSTLFGHAELPEGKLPLNELSLISECTSKALKAESVASADVSPALEEGRETYACHLCSFDTDRITSLDRHLLNHHKIGLENLLKLVMAKTKDGLSDERNTSIGIRQPYYRPQNEMIEEGEFIIETVTPQIKILKHASTNTEEINDFKVFNLEKNCQMISKEIESMLSGERSESDDFMSKMRTLDECMCKFVNSSNTLKKVLTRQLGSKDDVKERYNAGEPFFDLGLEGQETPRNWERAHSEKMERTRKKYGDVCRNNKTKQSSESFYF